MSDTVPVSAPAGMVPGSPTPSAAPAPARGNNLPPTGNDSAAVDSATLSPLPRAAARDQNVNSFTQRAASNQSSVAAAVQQLNKYLNDSGRANQFRVDPMSRDQTIQEINPSNGEVIGEYSVGEFPALARSLGVSGLLFDSHA